MEKDEKKVVETVENPTEVNEETIVTPEQDQNDNPVVDDNTELDSSDYTPDEDTVAVEEPTVTEIPVDAPIEDPTIATTDEIIPAPETEVTNQIDAELAPVENPGEELPVGTEPVVSEPVIPEDPATITPVEEPVLDAPLADIAPPMQDIPVDAPVEEPGCEGTCACGDPNCDGTCGCSNSECPSSSVTVGNFFGTIQECVTIVWRFHLKTRKHHIHVTLNEFYEKALDIVDDIIEQYQGICGVVEEPFVNCIVGDGKTEGEYLTELKAFVENNKCVLGDHSEINSTIDEFLALIDSTNYKLTAFTESAVKSFDEFVYEDYPAIKESCKYDRFGDRSCDDSDDEDYDPEFENGECSAEEE